MPFTFRFFGTIIAFIALILTAAELPIPQSAAQIADILTSLATFDRNGRDPARKLGFAVPERAVNEYLAYVLRKKHRPGIAAIRVALLPQNQVSADVEIDFDVIKKWRPAPIPDRLRSTLTGKRVLQTTADFTSKDGFLTFNLKDTRGPDGDPIPNEVVLAILQSIGSHQPEAYDTTRPIPLPFGLTRIWTERQLACGETSGSMTADQVAAHWENKLVRRRGNSDEDAKVYLVKDGRRCWVLSAKWVASHGYKWPGDVHLISSLALEGIPLGDPIR